MHTDIPVRVAIAGIFIFRPPAALPVSRWCLGSFVVCTVCSFSPIVFLFVLKAVDAHDFVISSKLSTCYVVGRNY